MNVGDYVLCEGEGSTVFRVDDLGGHVAWLVHERGLAYGYGHGWEQFDKLTPVDCVAPFTPRWPWNYETGGFDAPRGAK